MNCRSTVFAALAACGFGSSAVAQETVEVLHFWNSGGEAAAARVLSDALAEKGIVWQDSPATNTNNLNQVLRTRAVSGTAPAAVKLHLSEVFAWEEEGFLLPLDQAAAAGDWDQYMSQAAVAELKRNGHYYGVPVGVHGTNWMWYNPAVFEENGIEFPKTWDEFKAAAEALKAAGIIPLALGGQDWQEGILFEAVVVAVGGADFYRKALIEQDEAALQSETMVKIFEEFRNLNNYIDPNFPGRDWNVATQMVMQGEAAMQILGDYAKGEFMVAGLAPNVDYGCALVPGTAGTYIASTDVFAFFDNRDEATAQAQQVMAEIAMSPEVQIAFNQNKGSIPARLDVSPDTLDYCGQMGFGYRAEAEATGNILPAVSHQEGATPAKVGVFLEVTQTFFESPDMTAEEAIERLVSGLRAAD